MAREVNIPAVPALPISPSDYKQSWGAALLNILRLYFNQLSNLFSVLLGPSGGRLLGFPSMNALNDSNQYATGDNIPTQVLFTDGFSINGFIFSGGSAEAIYAGVYRVDYTMQLINSDATDRVVYIWVRVDGTDIPNSTKRFDIPSSGAFVDASSFAVFEMGTGQTVELYWATDKAFNPVGPVSGVFMHYTPAQASPFACPSTPSVFGVVTFVSLVP